MKKILLALALLFPSGAWAQCTGVFPPNTLCGNLSGSPAPPSAFSSGGTVTGPGSSVVNDVVTWNNTGGTSIKDSGVLISNVPLLNQNNTFTGTNSGLFTNIDSNTLNSQTANYTIATTDCGKTIQAGTGATGLFTITLPAVAGFATNCSVQVVNGDTGRGKILSGFPADVTPILWPNQSLGVKIVNGAWVSFAKPVRWQPTAVVTFHVNSATGSDTNNDCLSTTTGACATANRAMTLISNYLDNIAGITIQWDTNTTANFTALSYVGPGAITLNGNSTTMNVSTAPGGANVVIGAEGAPVYGNWIIQNFTLQSNTNPGIYGVLCAANTQCTVGSGMTFLGIPGGVTFPGGAIAGLFGANVRCSTGITIQSNWTNVLEADDFGRVDCAGITVTITGTPFFNGQTVFSHGAGAIVSIAGITWSGAVTAGIKRYTANLLGLIDSGACASIPGSVAGTPAPGTLGTDGGYCN